MTGMVYHRLLFLDLFVLCGDYTVSVKRSKIGILGITLTYEATSRYQTHHNSIFLNRSCFQLSH